MRRSLLASAAAAVVVLTTPAVAPAQALPVASALTAGVRSPYQPASLSAPPAARLRAEFAPDDADGARRRVPGLRGALVGALVGAGAGALYARAVCDAENCASHPDTRRLILGGMGVGALMGFTIDVVFWSPRQRTLRVRVLSSSGSSDVREALQGR